MNTTLIQILRDVEIIKGILLLKKFSEATNLIEKLIECHFQGNERTIDNEDVFEAYDSIRNLNYGTAADNLDQAIRKLKRYIFKNDCHVSWHVLARTDNDDVRFCRECRKNVYRVRNNTELNLRAFNNQCVAIKSDDFADDTSINHNNALTCILTVKDLSKENNVLLGNPF